MVCILTPLCCLTVQTFHNPEDMTICLPLRRYEISYFYSTYHLPVMGVGLQHRGARPSNLSSFAPQIGRCTHLIKTSMRGREIGKLGQRSLSCCLLGPIHLDDD